MRTLGKVVLTVLAIWLAISIVGFVIKGLFWLGVIGLVAFTVTAAVGAGKRSQLGDRR